jgi:signal transduction histidine kinase
MLLDGGRQCPLHEDADLAIYDRASVTPELTLKLIRASRSLPIAFATDQIDAHGHHQPVVTAVASEGAAEARAGTSVRSKAAGFAGVMDKPFLVTEFLATLKHTVGASAEWAPVDFFSTAVHELRTPLTSVLGQAQLALRYVESDPAKARAAIEHTIEQASRMNGLIGELLDHARITVGAPSLEMVSFDLGHALAIAIPQYEHGDVRRITFEVPADPVRVRGDPDRIAQIVGNLLDNALKYSPAGTPIVVSLAIVGKEAYVRVEDKGVGIAADERARIFAPFYRTSRTRDVPGTGLGLHISRRLAEQHRGRLWLEKSTDLGSVFTLALPILALRVPRRDSEEQLLLTRLATSP